VPQFVALSTVVGYDGKNALRRKPGTAWSRPYV